MGDKRRNQVFADFLQRRLPRNVRSLLVVADGNGELSAILRERGYAVRTLEPRPRHLPRGVKVEHGFFTADRVVREDAVVAMHPDEAALEIALWAKRCRKPFAVVPCCHVGLAGRERYVVNSKSGPGWVRRLRDIIGHSQTQVLDLPISGSNIVLFRI